MRYTTTLLTAALVCGSLSAQNDFFHYPTATTFTSRGNNGVNAGEILQGYHKESWRGIGMSSATSSKLVMLAATTQDQSAKTQETYYWVVRKGTDAAGPMLGTNGLLYKSAALKTPPSTSAGAAAFSITHTLTTAVQIPEDQFVSIGLQLAAAPKWTADGMSCHAASGATAGAGSQQKDHAWQILAKATKATHTSSMRAFNMGMAVASPVFQVGNVFSGKNNYGQGGLFPDVSKGQGLALRILAKGDNGQVALVFASGKFFVGKLPVFFGARLFLNPAQLVANPFLLGAVATDKAEVVAAAKIPSFMAKKSVAFQGVLVDLKKVSLTLTNAVRTQF